MTGGSLYPIMGLYWDYEPNFLQKTTETILGDLQIF